MFKLYNLLLIIVIAGLTGCSSISKHLIDYLYPNTVNYIHCKDNYVVLTIDDGPDECSTERILTLLEKNNATATFFVTPTKNNAHILASINPKHDFYNHSSFIKAPKNCEQRIQAIKTAQTFINQYSNDYDNRERFFRPPEGKLDQHSLQYLHDRTIIMASYYPFDYQIKSSLINYYLTKPFIKPGNIIIFHQDSGRGIRTEKSLEKLFAWNKQQKNPYHFMSLSQALQQGCKIPSLKSTEPHPIIKNWFSKCKNKSDCENLNNPN